MDDDFPYTADEATALMAELHQEIFDACARFLDRTDAEQGIVPAALIDAAAHACAAYCCGDGNDLDEGRRIVMEQLEKWQENADLRDQSRLMH